MTTNRIQIRAQKATIKMTASKQTEQISRPSGQLTARPNPPLFVCGKKRSFSFLPLLPLSALWGTLEGGSWSWAELIHLLPAAEMDDNLTPFPLLVQQNREEVFFSSSCWNSPPPRKGVLTATAHWLTRILSHAHTSQSPRTTFACSQSPWAEDAALQPGV